MTVSLDVLIGTLIFVLPGFVTVGAYAGLGRFFSRPDLTRGTFVLLALVLSLPLLLVFNFAVSYFRLSLVAPVGVPELETSYVAPAFLLSLSLLYAVSAGLGGVVALGFNGWNVLKRKRGGSCHRISRLDVWTTVIGSRTQTPYVVLVLEKCAYHGLMRQATTEDEDPYVFISRPDFLPLDKNQCPDWKSRTQLDVDGILIRKNDIKAFWIVS